MGTGVLGQVNLAIEQNPGEQPLLPYTAVAGTMNLTTAPSGPQGMRLHVYVKDNTATGTITITGKDINGNTITETIPPTGVITIAPVGAQNDIVGNFEWESQNVFGSQTATANAIATTGLTGGFIQVGGTYAGKLLQPCDLDFDYHPDLYSPDEFRGSYDRDFVIQQLRRIATVDKFDQDFYPEVSVWLLFLMISSNITVTTLPASPTVLKASTLVATTPQSLTTQPSLPGMKLQFVLTGVGATGTIVITGTDIFGNAATETINVANIAAQTLYSTKVYQTVSANGIAYTGMTGGSAAINGVFGFAWTALPLATTGTSTAVMEFFTGVESGVLPFIALEDATLDWAVDKVARIASKGIAQDWLPIGDRTTGSLVANRISTLGIPTDIPLVGTESQMWIDPIPGTPQTTVFGDMLSAKINWKWPVIPKWTATNSPVMNRIYRRKRETLIDLTIDQTTAIQREKFRQNLAQYFAFQLNGPSIGGGNNKGLTIIAPAKTEKYKAKPGVDKENVEVDMSLRLLYDTGLGATFKVVLVNQTPPTYTS